MNVLRLIFYVETLLTNDSLLAVADVIIVFIVEDDDDAGDVDDADAVQKRHE